jgi:hypothetical protein
MAVQLAVFILLEPALMNKNGSLLPLMLIIGFPLFLLEIALATLAHLCGLLFK